MPQKKTLTFTQQLLKEGPSSSKGESEGLLEQGKGKACFSHLGSVSLIGRFFLSLFLFYILYFSLYFLWGLV